MGSVVVVAGVVVVGSVGVVVGVVICPHLRDSSRSATNVVVVEDALEME